MPGPLHGLRVLDLTRVLAGPFCTMILADLGAEVIKIERPHSGDDSRAFGPFLGGESAYFMSINRGKKSMTLDFKNPRAIEVFKRLVAGADILVENFKPGVMTRLGIGYEALAALNPRLIYAASSGFGQTGPYSSRPAYDLIIQGMGGLMSITGPDPKHPTKVGSSIADIFAGVFCAIGILAALQSRERTGKGQMVDVAMLDCMVAILENAIARFVAVGKDPEPIGNTHPSIAPFTTLETADGAMNIACGNDSLWQKFCALIKRPDLAADHRFATNPLRVQNLAELVPLLNEATRTRETKDWLEVLQAGDIPCGPINRISDVLSDPQVLARQMIAEIFHPTIGTLKVPGVPIKLSETPGCVAGPAPRLGEHTEQVLGELLGLTATEIDALRSAGAF
jgi:CoA:oxalate CoA-transferase